MFQVNIFKTGCELLWKHSEATRSFVLFLPLNAEISQMQKNRTGLKPKIIKIQANISSFK